MTALPLSRAHKMAVNVFRWGEDVVVPEAQYRAGVLTRPSIPLRVIVPLCMPRPVGLKDHASVKADEVDDVLVLQSLLWPELVPCQALALWQAPQGVFGIRRFSPHPSRARKKNASPPSHRYAAGPSLRRRVGKRRRTGHATPTTSRGRRSSSVATNTNRAWVTWHASSPCRGLRHASTSIVIDVRPTATSVA